MRPGQQSPRKRPEYGQRWSYPRSFNEAGATIAPETANSTSIPGARNRRFNEAGATIAPETLEPCLDFIPYRLASMRPGQQSPRKRVRKRNAHMPFSCFNEAGATIAPETVGDPEYLILTSRLQ